MKSLIQDVYRCIKYYNSTPFTIKHDDLYLVEYPKSGVTWLSFIFANIIQKNTDDDFNIKGSTDQIELSHEYVAPENEIEEIFVSIWEKFLSIDKISVAISSFSS